MNEEDTIEYWKDRAARAEETRSHTECAEQLERVKSVIRPLRAENRALRQMLGHIQSQTTILIGNPYGSFVREGLAKIEETP